MADKGVLLRRRPRIVVINNLFESATNLDKIAEIRCCAILSAKWIVAEEGRSGSGWETISGGKFGKFGTSTRFNVIESSSEILKFPGKKFFLGGDWTR